MESAVQFSAIFYKATPAGSNPGMSTRRAAARTEAGGGPWLMIRGGNQKDTRWSSPVDPERPADCPTHPARKEGLALG
jgi:hypothetical protein